jgi:hypothetical protein
MPVKTWHRVLGELHYMTIGLPGYQGLFGTLQERLRHTNNKYRIRLSTSVHDLLGDFR